MKPVTSENVVALSMDITKFLFTELVKKSDGDAFDGVDALKALASSAGYWLAGYGKAERLMIMESFVDTMLFAAKIAEETGFPKADVPRPAASKTPNSSPWGRP
jgi:hypothetical protein